MAPPRSSARFIARTIKGAVPATMPGFIDPQLAILRSEPPAGTRWVHEIKFDGWRAQAYLDAGRARIMTRRGHDYSDRFASIAHDVMGLKANKLILDGEIVGVDEKGMPRYSALIEERSLKSAADLAYFAFDLLYLDGFDLRGAPLIDRKRVLSLFIQESKASRILFSKHTEGDGQEIYAAACRMKLEGIVSKPTDPPYRSGRTGSWEKVKCTTRAFFPVIGFIPATGGSIAALYLGRKEGRTLVYAGKVGTGFTMDEVRDLRDRLEELAVKDPVVKGLKKPKARWVLPRLAVEVEYLELTASGQLRHPSYKGIREPRL